MCNSFPERSGIYDYCGVCLVGTGKSTVVKFVVAALNLDPKDIKYVTFTGKAAQVLRSKGHNATTIHKLIYQSFLMPSGKFVYRKLPKNEVKAKVIIVDEISMVPAKLLQDLASYGIHMILLGDPGQLPPIGDDNRMLENPHVFLDEIMRQALDNTIIYLSMLIREGKEIPYINDEYVRVVDKKDFNLGMVAWADQVICGKNATRRMVNNIVRQSKGFVTEMPCPGDKVICLRNNWEFMNEEEMPLVNGTIGYVKSFEMVADDIPLGPVMKNSRISRMTFEPDFTGEFVDVNIDPNVIRGLDSVLMQQVNAGIRKPESFFQEFDYGYAITCHKSQGSSWKNVVVLEETLNRAHHRKWLYTAITRAEQKLVLVLDR